MKNKCQYKVGKRYEKKERELWEKCGCYVVESRGSHGLFDLLIVLPIGSELGEYARGVQIKSGKTRPSEKAVNEFKEECKKYKVMPVYIWYDRSKSTKAIRRILT